MMNQIAQPAAMPPGMMPNQEEQPDQWLDSVMTLRPELRFDVRDRDGNVIVIIEDPVRGKFFQIGADEYRFIASVDGNRTGREIVAALTEKAESLAVDRRKSRLTDDSAKTICQWLVNSNLVHSQAVDSAKRLDQQVQAMDRQKLIGLMNPISMKFKLFNPNNLLAKIQPACQWLFSKWFLAVWLCVGGYALSIIYQNWGLMGESSVGILSGTRWIWMLIVFTVLKVIHEAAHGIACRRYGGEVPEAGVLLLLFTPMAFVNVTSSWRFENRFQRMVVAAAGMYVELFIAFISIILWAKYPNGMLADVCFQIFIMSSVTTILFNANPLMRFDGYFILSDLVNIPNLYTKGTRWFGDQLKHLFFGFPPTPNNCQPHETRRCAIYGSMAFFWKILISISLTIGASVMFYGAGLAMAAIGIVLFFGLPILNQYRTILGDKAQHKVNWLRFAVVASMFAAIGLCLFYVLKAPATKSAPAIVQFKDETLVRADADGFIRELLVSDGQKVTQGDTLVLLENPQLSHELLELEKQADEAKIQARIYKQTDEMALAMAELENLEGLLEQVTEKREQLAGLKVIAPFDGFVFQRDLHNRIDSFLRRGDPIFSLAQRATKEVVVSIDQKDLESIKGNEGQLLRVAIPGISVFESRLTRLDPRATDQPSHPTLTASAGGELPVKPNGDATPDDESGSMVLLSPRFTVDLEVSEEVGQQLHSGQRGRAFFSANRQSMGAFLYLATCDWFKEKLEIAMQTSPF